jgi:hypothetical protein
VRHHYAICTGVVLAIAGTALGGAASLTACGTNAIGVDACRRVEEARCKRAESCGVSLASPPHTGAPTTDVDACISYYRDACLHGLVRVAEPSTAEVDACVTRIESGTCEATVTPTEAPECAWLGTELGDAAGDAEASTTTDASAETSTQEADSATVAEASPDATSD